MKVGGDIMKKIGYITILFVVSLLTACSDGSYVQTLSDPTPDQEMEASQHGLTLSLSTNEYEEGSPLFDTIIQNNSPTSYEYGGYFHIEVLKDDQWYLVTHSDAVFYDNSNFTNLGHLLQPGKEMHQTYSVETLGITLLPGQYRFVKILLKPIAPVQVVRLAVPFTVNAVGI